MAKAPIQHEEAEAPLDMQSSANFQQMLNAAGLSEDYTTGDGEVALEEIANSLSELKRLKEDKQVPEKYDFGLPQDFKNTEGFEWKPDPNFTEKIQKVGQELGLSQDGMSKLVMAYAEHQLGQMENQKAQELQTAAQARKEREKLGPDFPDRREAIRKHLDAIHGEGAGEEFLRGGTARGFQMLEDLVQRANGAGRSAPGRGGEPAPQRLSRLVGQKGGARALLHAAYGQKQ